MTHTQTHSSAPIPYSPIPYSPVAVPERQLTNPSIRDDVRRTLHRYKFRPSLTHYTSTQTIYNLYLSDTRQASTPSIEDKFRSALGRVLRPPRRADAYAQSYAVPGLQRWNGHVSIVAPGVDCLDPRVENRNYKSEMGKRMREVAKVSECVRELREERRDKRERDRGLTVCEEPPQQVSFRYVDEFLALNCAEDLIQLKLFPNGKEMAESMSAYAAVRQYLHVHAADHEEIDGILSFKDPNVLLVAVGDGVTPRTAALFAFRSAWRCVSIDPAMRSNGAWSEVSSLTTLKSRVQDVAVSVKERERVVVVMWHCHCGIDEALGCLEYGGVKWNCSDEDISRQLRKRVAVVSCACCNYDAVQRVMPDGAPPDVEFEDLAVPGLMRTVRVWKFLK